MDKCEIHGELYDDYDNWMPQKKVQQAVYDGCMTCATAVVNNLEEELVNALESEVIAHEVMHDFGEALSKIGEITREIENVPPPEPDDAWAVCGDDPGRPKIIPGGGFSMGSKFKTCPECDGQGGHQGLGDNMDFDVCGTCLGDGEILDD